MVCVDRNAGSAVDRDRFGDFDFRSGERERSARQTCVEGNGRARFGVLNRFAEANFAVERVDDVGERRNGRRIGVERQVDGFRGGRALSVDGQRAITARLTGLEGVGRPGRRVRVETSDERPSFAVRAEPFDLITGFVGRVIRPRQRRGLRRRVKFRAQTGRSERRRARRFVSADVDRREETRIAREVERQRRALRVDGQRVGAFVERLRVFGQRIVAVFRVFKKRLRRVVNIMNDVFFRFVRPSGEGREDVVSVQRREVGINVVIGAVDDRRRDVADDDRIAQRRRRGRVVTVKPAAGNRRFVAGDRRVDQRRFAAEHNAAAGRVGSVFGDQAVDNRRRFIRVNAAASFACRDVADDRAVFERRRPGNGDSAAVRTRDVAGDRAVRQRRFAGTRINAAAVVNDVGVGNRAVRQRRGRGRERNAAAVFRRVAGKFAVFDSRFAPIRERAAAVIGVRRVVRKDGTENRRFRSARANASAVVRRRDVFGKEAVRNFGRAVVVNIDAAAVRRRDVADERATFERRETGRRVNAAASFRRNVVFNRAVFKRDDARRVDGAAVRREAVDQGQRDKFDRRRFRSAGNAENSALRVRVDR